MDSDAEMSKAKFRLAYDGPALASHTMDVRSLAPSLLGLGEVFLEANKIFNGKDSKLEIHVTPNIEENCFDIGLEIIQRWEAIKTLLGREDIAKAKDLLDWIILNKEISAGFLGGLILLYKRFAGRKPVSVIFFKDENGNNLYRYQFDSGDDEILDEKLHRLYQSKKIRSQLKRLLKPVAEQPGIDEITAYEEGKRTEGHRITKDEVLKIDFSIDDVLSKPEDDDREIINAVLRVYSPVYDMSAPRWRFWYEGDHHYMDVKDSNIGEVVLENGGALIDDRFVVKLQKQKKDPDAADSDYEYKVLEVTEFIPAFRQPDLFGGENGQDT